MLVERAGNGYSDFRIPGIVATSEGSLLRYCECRRSQGDWADIDLKVSRSTDGGKSWETVLLIESGGSTLNNPVMIADGDRLVFLYCKNYREIRKRVSLDDGKSFGESVRVDFEREADFFYNAVAIGPGHGTVHRERLIVPIWFAYNRENEKSHHPSFISTLYSDDRGESWHLGEMIFRDILTDPSECALAVTAEDEILISIRHEGEARRRALAVSTDGASGWRGLRFEENLPDPVCMGSMTHRDGRIYHSNCASDSARKNLTVKISRDGFETCRSIFISEAGGYSDVALLGNRLCVFYEKTVRLKADGKTVTAPFELFFEAIDIAE